MLSDPDDIKAWVRGTLNLSPEESWQAWNTLSDDQKRKVLDVMGQDMTAAQLGKAWEALYWRDHQGQAWLLIVALAVAFALLVTLVIWLL